MVERYSFAAGSFSIPARFTAHLYTGVINKGLLAETYAMKK
jgi:hypothetical protein